jgi:hypothetical protein
LPIAVGIFRRQSSVIRRLPYAVIREEKDYEEEHYIRDRIIRSAPNAGLRLPE